MNVLNRIAAFFTFGKLVSSLRPVWASFVEQAEELLPDGGNGEKKLAYVKAAMAKVFDGIEGFAHRFEEAWPVIQTFIAGYVAFQNAAGLFKKGNPSGSTGG